MMLRLQSGEIAFVLRLVKRRENDCLDKLLGTFYEVMVDGSRKTISAIDVAEVLEQEINL